MSGLLFRITLQLFQDRLVKVHCKKKAREMDITKTSKKIFKTYLPNYLYCTVVVDPSFFFSARVGRVLSARVNSPSFQILWLEPMKKHVQAFSMRKFTESVSTNQGFATCGPPKEGD